MDLDQLSLLNRAKELLAKQDDSLLRYACLELRLCLEAITYKKLQLYAPRLPASVLEKWQPPQAVRALLEFEPHADRDYGLRVCPETSTGVPNGNWISLGTHRTFRAGWLGKHYNKLGSHLHISAPSEKYQQRDLVVDHSTLRAYLEEVVTELEPIVTCSFDATFARTATFECTVCSQPVIVNYDRALETKKATCLNSNCRAEFAGIAEENSVLTFRLMASTLTCASCGSGIEIENRKLAIGYDFSCPKCGKQYMILNRNWGIAFAQEDEEPSSQDEQEPHL